MTAARVAAMCPGASLNQKRVDAILMRWGVRQSDLHPGGRYDARAIKAKMQRDQGSQPKINPSASCQSLSYNYGPYGLTLPAIAVLPMTGDYPN